MQAGTQSRGLSFWDHGALVAARFRDLLSDAPAMTWRLPTWFTDHAPWIRARLSAELPRLQRYQQWHDCGKPYCRTVDADGRVHYPDHAAVSARVWREAGGEEAVASLIERDMHCHLLRPADAPAFAAEPDALALLVTALCELHANAGMFGGLEADSFKIKYKRLDRCGAVILNHLLKEQP